MKEGITEDLKNIDISGNLIVKFIYDSMWVFFKDKYITFVAEQIIDNFYKVARQPKLKLSIVQIRNNRK